MKKMLQELNLSDDFLFAKVMSDKEICKQVIEKILKIEIKDIKMPEKQKVIDMSLDSKAIRLDVYVNDDKGTVYNIEMQTGKNKNLAKRSRYYQGNIDLDLLVKGADYKLLNQSFVIFICTFDPFGKGRHIYTFENRCIEDLNINLNDQATKVFINTTGTLDDVDKEFEQFLKYIEQTTNDNVKNDFIKAIHNKVVSIKNDREMEVQYMTLLEREREKYEEGLEEGMGKGLEKAAISLLDILDDETIARKLKMSLERVKELRKQNEH